MKTFRILAVLAIIVTTLGAGVKDYLADMKTTMDGVETCVKESISYGSLRYPSACAVIPHAKRAAVVRAVGEFARTFTASAAFKTWYDEMREERKPAPPTLTPSMGESRSQQVVEIKKQIAETEKAMASATADQKGMYKDVLNAMKAALKEAQGSDKSQDGEMDKMIEQSNADAKAEHAKELAEFEREYPKGDPRPLIRRRLQAFLDKTGNVDFSAKLQKKGSHMVFVNPDYESQSGDWKLAFRAGKEATEAARAVAREWLKAL